MHSNLFQTKMPNICSHLPHAKYQFVYESYREVILLFKKCRLEYEQNNKEIIAYQVESLGERIPQSKVYRRGGREVHEKENHQNCWEGERTVPRKKEFSRYCEQSHSETRKELWGKELILFHKFSLRAVNCSALMYAVVYSHRYRCTLSSCSKKYSGQ